MIPSERLQETEDNYEYEERNARGLAQVDIAIDKFNAMFNNLKFILDDLQKEIDILKEQKK